MGTWYLIVLFVIPYTSSSEKECLSNILNPFLSDSSKTKESYHTGETIFVACPAESYYDYGQEGDLTQSNNVVLSCTDGKWIGHYPECFLNCTKPEIDAILNPEYDSYAPGDKVTVTECKVKTGNVEGDPALVCKADGTWIGSASCPKEHKSCSEKPPDISNAYITVGVLDEYKHGTVLRYKCGQAFDQMGKNNFVTCQDGQWILNKSDLMRCTIGQCRTIYNHEVDNGHVKHISGTVGTYAEFQCYDGYELDGSAQILCMADRRWHPEIPKCKPIFCPIPKKVIHGRMIQEVYNGVLNIYQSKIRYECDKGYRMVGPQFRTCQSDRTWSGNDTKCEEILCDKPSPPENGKVYLTDNSEKVGSQIEYTCDERHILVPNTSQFDICTEHGHWSRRKPECKKYCEVRSLQHGSFSDPNRFYRKITDDTYVLDNTELFFACGYGYEAYALGYNTNGRLKCSNGTWLPGSPECKPKRCQITKINNLKGNFTYSETTISAGEMIPSDSYIRVKCYDGYELYNDLKKLYMDKDNTHIQCYQGSFRSEIPSCKPNRCQITETISNGILRYIGNVITDGMKIPSGNDIHLICRDGYEVYNESKATYMEKDNMYIKCTQGSFIDGFPSCIAKRCQISNITDIEVYDTSKENATAVGEKIPSGSTILLMCRVGYELYDESKSLYMERKDTNITCYQGRFEADIPSCKPNRCQITETIPNGNLSYKENVIAEGMKIPSDNDIHLICFDGYELYNESKATYMEKENMNIKCTQGSFICGFPSCKAKRCQISNTTIIEVYDTSKENATAVGEKIPSGSTILLMCPVGYELYDESKSLYMEREDTNITCYQGRFEADIPSCKPRRCQVTDITVINGHFRYNGNVIPAGEKIPSGSKIQLICSEGYELYPEVTLMYIEKEDTDILCHKGSFDTAIPSCKPKFCNEPPVRYIFVEHGTNVDENAIFSHGTKLNVSCDSSSTLHTDKDNGANGTLSECIHGEWKPTFSCKPVSCNLDDAGMLIIFPSNSTLAIAGEKVKVSCKFGYQSVLSVHEDTYNYPDNESAADSSEESETNNSYTVWPVMDGNYTCGDNGRWEPEMRFSCKHVLCESFDDYSLENGNIIYSSNRVNTVGTVVEFRCNPGYNRHGPESRKCQMDGTWSGTCVTCQSNTFNVTTTCPAPCIPEGARKTGSHTYEIGSKIEFRCTRSKSPSRDSAGNIWLCIKDGEYARWDGKKIKCKETICDDEDHYGFENGRIHYSSSVYTVGTIASFSCYPGYERQGPETRTCLKNGTWSGGCVTCQNIQYNFSTCPAPCVPDGAIKIGSQPYEIGSRIQYYCVRSNMQSDVESSYLYCVNNSISPSWNGTVINCKAECKPLKDAYKVVKSGVIPGILSDETIVEVNCSEILTSSDDIRTAECREGIWHPRRPNCKKSCSLPPVKGTQYKYKRASAKLIHGDIMSGMRVKVTCESGFVPSRRTPNAIKCKNGVWKPELVRCQRKAPDTCSLPPVVGTQYKIWGGEEVIHGNSTSGTQIVVKCESGFVLKKKTTDVINCVNGSWKPELVQCQKEDTQND